MATPKKQKLSDMSTTTSVSGYIMNVSPQMRTSQKGFPFFNARIQEENKTSCIVGFTEKKRKELRSMEEQRSPVKLSAIDYVPSFKTPGEFDIKVNNATTIKPTKLDFTFEQQQSTAALDPKTLDLKIRDVKSVPEDSKVTVTAKVTKCLESVEQDIKFNRRMLRTTYIVADETAAIKLTLWGTDQDVQTGHTYKFENLSIKTFDCVKLATNPYTKITPASNIEDIVDDTEIENSDVKRVQGRISGVSVDLLDQCFFCKQPVTVNKDISSLKCPACHKRQLVTTVSKSVNTQISLCIKDSVETYTVPKDVLNVYTIGIDNLEDKELFILNHANVELTIFNKIVTEMKEIL